jgi:hypothetical protein
MKSVAVVLITAFATYALADANPSDFARGFRVNVEQGQPLVHVSLPDEVYQISTTPTLNDVAVFNADGTQIPHAICRAPETQPEQIQEQTLPIFESNTSASEQDGTNVQVQTTTGTHVNVDEKNSGSNAETRFLIDARGPDAPIRAITFDWSSSDHASEVRVSIESSSDLDSWRTVVPGTTLLRANGTQNQLRRDRVQLPATRYDYLRVRRVDSGPLLELQSVTAEVVTTPAAIEPIWVVAQPQRSTDTSELYFDSGRVAPIGFVRLRVPLDNYSLAAEIATRDDDKSAWVSRWTGESYVVTTGNNRRESDAARVQSVTDRYWRVHIAGGPAPNMSMELGYRPSLVEFIAQGAGPFTVAFGSRRADHAPAVACGSLLSNMPSAERDKLISEALAGPITALGGDTALQAAPRKTPTRLIILWGSLIVGVALLMGMALSLIKRLRSEPPSG